MRADPAVRTSVQANYWGTYHVAHAVLPGMRARGEGRLVFISSPVLIAPMIGYSAYAASKAAVRPRAYVRGSAQAEPCCTANARALAAGSRAGWRCLRMSGHRARERQAHACWLLESPLARGALQQIFQWAVTDGAVVLQVRALADCLRSELHGTGVCVSVGYPPDTQTPGFDLENAAKPVETKMISEAFQDTVFSAEKVARCMFRGLKRGLYHLSSPDPGHQAGLSLIAGSTPRPWWLVVEVLMAPFLVIASWVVRMVIDGTVAKARRQHAAAARGAT
jgi:short chain dehydrogenase